MYFMLILCINWGWTLSQPSEWHTAQTSQTKKSMLQYKCGSCNSSGQTHTRAYAQPRPPADWHLTVMFCSKKSTQTQITRVFLILGLQDSRFFQKLCHTGKLSPGLIGFVASAGLSLCPKMKGWKYFSPTGIDEP